MSIEGIESPLSSPSIQEPIRFFQLLSLFNCESVTEILLYRASQRPVAWNSAGELVQLDLNCLHLLYPEFESIVRDGRYSLSHERVQNIGDLIESEKVAAKGRVISRKDTQLSILALVASAFPEPWCEMVWEDVERQLWRVVESICLPLLGVLDGEDIENFIKDSLRHQKRAFLFVLTKFLIRLRILLKCRTSPNLLSLIPHCCELFREHSGQGNSASRDDLQYLRYLASRAEILNSTNQPRAKAKSLLDFTHGGSKRLNATIGFALGSLPPSWMAPATDQSLTWKLVSAEAPSTMEVIAQSQLFGVISITKLPAIRLERLSLETRVLIAFCEAEKKAFSNTAEVLEKLITEIEEAYGTKSLELLLVGTVLVNCYNATEREESGEKLARYIWSNVFEGFTLDASIKTTEQVYLMIAMADSFLGQTKYDEARLLLNKVLEHSATDVNLVMSSILRLLKISRRTRRHSVLLEDWNKVNDGVKIFDEVSDILKYEFIEEVVCFLSLLEPKESAKVPRISEVVKTLGNYRLSTYRGSPASRLNLGQNLEELNRFKRKFNLFLVSGPQLLYYRKLRERFPFASIGIIEKVGSANWQIYTRIKEMREMEDNAEIEAQAVIHPKSIFHDSGLGSSQASDPTQKELAHGPLPKALRFVTSIRSFMSLRDRAASLPKALRSVTSIRSFMSLQDRAASLPTMPLETTDGERICYICERSINGVKNENQWRRHAFSDLRPYVCILEDCDADFEKFTSRAEFAAHLGEHRHTKLWTCMHCGHEEGRKQQIEDHILFTHTSHEINLSTIAISQKTVLRDISSQRCPFCHDIPGSSKFVGHICHHLEEISLSAMSLGAKSDGEIDGESISGASFSSGIGSVVAISHEEDFAQHSQLDLPGVSPQVQDHLQPSNIIVKGLSGQPQLFHQQQASQAPESITFFLNQNRDEVTEDVVSEVAGNEKIGRDGMEHLLDKRGDEVRITDAVVNAAARNEKSDVMKLLLDRRGDEVQITDAVVYAAAINKKSGVMKLLLERRVINLADLATKLRNQSRWKEAEELELQVMNKRETELGVEHPDTLTSMCNIATIYINQGRLKESADFEQRVMEIKERVLGTRRPDTETTGIIEPHKNQHNLQTEDNNDLEENQNDPKGSSSGNFASSNPARILHHTNHHSSRRPANSKPLGYKNKSSWIQGCCCCRVYTGLGVDSTRVCPHCHHLRCVECRLERVELPVDR